MSADAAIELTCDLVALDTVNPALVPGAPGERAAVELLAARLELQGFTLEIVGPPERPSLVATRRSGSGRVLALNGHLDRNQQSGQMRAHRSRAAGRSMSSISSRCSATQASVEAHMRAVADAFDRAR